MLTLVNILICFFIFLILYQIILESNVVEAKLPLVEGLENEFQSYDTNNPNNAMILAQQNAGNILYLRDRIDNSSGLYQQVQDISGNVQTLQTQVNDLVQAQQDYANQMTGGVAPEITGTTTDDNEDDNEDDTFTT